MRKSLFIAILVSLVSVSTAFAQGTAVKSSTQGNNPAKPTGPLPNGKVAIIDSRAFPEGISEYKKLIDKVNAEFGPQAKEMEALQKQYTTLEDELKTGGANMQQKVYQQKVEQLQTLEKDIKRKGEDYQQAYQKKLDQVTEPVRDKVLKFLENYANTREIVLIFDLAPAAQNGGLVFLNPASVITDDFIKEYNKLNPVAGAPPQPEPRR